MRVYIKYIYRAQRVRVTCDRASLLHCRTLTYRTNAEAQSASLGEGIQLLKTSVLSPSALEACLFLALKCCLWKLLMIFQLQEMWSGQQSWKGAGWFVFDNVLIAFYHLSHVKTCPILQGEIQYSVSQP